jgi:hypothetical protein
MGPRPTFQLSDDQQAVMACVDSFEQTAGDTEADLRKYLGTVPEKFRSVALVELVRVDFERRWKKGQLRKIVEYLREYPEIRESGAFSELLQAEFDFRRRAGDTPDVAEYRAIEPSFTPPLDTAGHQETQPLHGSTAPVQRELQLPERIGRYKIVRLLGTGGFGLVYLARDEQLQRDVAIKVRRGTREKPGLSADQLHEGRAVSKLDHPGIVKVIDADQSSEGLGYVVYEYVAGETLQSRIVRGGYSRAEAAEWVACVAETLQYAHERDIVHRDIKPANIILDGNGQPKLLDFGLARHDGKFFVDERGQLVGTAAYMSPEQANYDPQFSSPLSDLYSLGVVLYELLCGQRPFDSRKLEDLLDEILRRTPTPPRSLDGTIPKELEEVCLKAIAKDPADRYRNGADMAAAVRAAIRPPDKWTKTLVRYAAGAAAVAAVAILAATVLMNRGDSPKAVPPRSSVTAAAVEEFDIYADRFSIRRLERPLASTDSLELQAKFDRPSYAYVFAYEQDGTSELLYPLPEKIATQAKRSKLKFPPSTHEYTLPPADGATLMVVLLSEERFTKARLDQLLAARLTLGVTRESASRQKPFWWLEKEGCDNLHFNPPPTLGLSRRPEALLDVPQTFRDMLGKTYCGFLMSHQKPGEEKP